MTKNKRTIPSLSRSRALTAVFEFKTRLLITSIAALFAVSLIPAFPVAAASVYPAGFSDVLVAGGLAQPVAMEFAPDGRLFITEKAGNVRIVKNGNLLPTPFASLTVDASAERGLLGVTVDPNFAINHYIYVHYMSPSAGPGGTHGRISRLTASATDLDVMEPGSETYLIDDIPSPTGIHDGGEIHFGIDGKLYAAIGDGGFGSTRSQDMNSLGGKILRINSDGSIPADNPFVGVAGARPEIYALGMRNPFTFAIDPVSGQIFANDVGQDTWEEIDDIHKGANYGWPICEGVCNNPAYTDPVYTYNHNGTGHSITGGAFYHGTNYPAQYANQYFFGDYTAGFIKTLDFANGAQATDFGNTVKSPVNIKSGPDGNLYYTSITSGNVYKIQYSPSSPPALPGSGNGLYGSYYNNKTMTGAPVLSRVDPTINFDWGAGSPDRSINVDQFSAQWTGQVQAQYSQDYTFSVNGDDGVRLSVNGVVVVDKYVDQPATETSGTISLLAGQKYAIKLEYFESYGNAVAQLSWASPSQPKVIIPQSQLFATLPGTAPVATIATPLQNQTYNAGDTINYGGSATDAEDGILPASAYAWTVVYHHAYHTHPFSGPTRGSTTGSFLIPTVGEPSADTYYELQLTVTDSSGQTNTASRTIYPNKSTISLATNITGASLSLDAQPKVMPYSVVGVAGFSRNLSAPLSQTVSGMNYNFVSWSDGGLADHTITTALTDTLYTATYQAGTAPTPPPPTTNTLVTVFAAGTPAGNVYPTAQLLVDDHVVATFTDIRGDANNRLFQTFSYTSPVTLTPERVKVSYINDAVINNEDRNLRVDKIMLDNLSYETEDPGVVSTGTWAPDTGCGIGNKKSEWLQCNGYFSYGTTPVTTATGSVVKIFAAGTAAAGVFPTMNLLIDGAVLSTYQNIQGDANARTFIEYDYLSPTKLSINQLKLQFTNDFATATEDRNLRVDKIVLDGIEYQTEAPTTNSTGTWDSATGCSAGNKQSEWMHCNGIFSY